MSVTGTVRVDLTDVPRERQRHRAAALGGAPTGARVVLLVGALAVEPDAVRVVRDHADRLHVDVQGTVAAVQRWVGAIRTGDMLPLDGAA